MSNQNKICFILLFFLLGTPLYTQAVSVNFNENKNHQCITADSASTPHYKVNVSISTPLSFIAQKFRTQAEFNLSEKQSIGINMTNLFTIWQTTTVGLEYRYYTTIRKKSKIGFYSNLSSGSGKADNFNSGRFAAISAGMVNQIYLDKKQRLYFDFQVGGRAGAMITGDLESGGGFGGLLYIAGPLSVLDFRMNFGFRI